MDPPSVFVDADIAPFSAIGSMDEVQGVMTSREAGGDLYSRDDKSEEKWLRTRSKRDEEIG